MPSTHDAAPPNRLLEALPQAARDDLLPHCELVELAATDILGESGKPIRAVHFPIECIATLVVPDPEHSGLEVGLVGGEGMLGLPLLLNLPVWPLDAMVQHSGSAWRMEAAPFREALGRHDALQRRLFSYLYVSLRQLAQSTACARFHVVEARLARWLLMTRDRAHTDTFEVTQASLAHLLGVRRVGITEAAGALQRKRLIAYQRGRVTVLDGEGLLAAACRCYGVDKAVYDRMLGQPE